MNELDVAILLLLALFALRGFWRGFFRESFGFLAFLAGVAAALQYTGAGAVALAQHVDLPGPAHAGIAFIGIFMGVHTSITLLGWLLDRVASTLLFRSVNRMAGAVFAIGKGGAILAFVLLFFQVFSVVPELEKRIMTSELARPLVSVASTVIRTGWREAPEAGKPGQV